jgi:hypothetical protein
MNECKSLFMDFLKKKTRVVQASLKFFITICFERQHCKPVVMGNQVCLKLE